MIFAEQPDGLYAFDTGISPSTSGAPTPLLFSTSPHGADDPSISDSVGFTLIQTVTNNKTLFTQREITAADRARALYRMLGRPSQQKFEDILSKNIIVNCPVTVDDAKRANIIYGPDIATLKGNTNRGQPAARVPDFTAV
jgi:hypothetical protein